MITLYLFYCMLYQFVSCLGIADCGKKGKVSITTNKHTLLSPPPSQLWSSCRVRACNRPAASSLPFPPLTSPIRYLMAHLASGMVAILSQRCLVRSPLSASKSFCWRSAIWALLWEKKAVWSLFRSFKIKLAGCSFLPGPTCPGKGRQEERPRRNQ